MEDFSKEVSRSDLADYLIISVHFCGDFLQAGEANTFRKLLHFFCCFGVFCFIAVFVVVVPWGMSACGIIVPERL